MHVIIVGVIMLVVFMGLILFKKVSALTALVIVPMVFGFIAGFGTDTFRYAWEGITSVGSTVAMLTFAILYFGIMLSTGLFDPLAKIVLKYMKGDPLRVIMGTAILATLVSLDGDGTTTVMICCAALLPVYNKLNINRVYLVMFIMLPNGVINLLPWGGPTARLLSVLPVDSNELLVRLLPLMLGLLVVVYVLAFVVGMSERKHLGIQNIVVEAKEADISDEEKEFRRPKHIWFNFILTVICMLAIIALGIPGPLVFAFASCIALTVNYHNLKTERRVIKSTAEGIISVVVMILGAGILMGVLSSSGMADSMANAMIAAFPTSWGKYFNLFLAGFSGPAVWILNNDAFYFGLMPVLSKTASSYGFSDMQIAVASLLGQNLRGFSPVIPSLYFVTSHANVEFSEFQKKMIPVCLIAFAAALVIGGFMGIYTVA